ncbi:hypothetical protein [Microvirga tunisiensis]|nr:hypothetical protein [Microvirga tunisiensis]
MSTRSRPMIYDQAGEIIRFDAMQAPAIMDRVLNGWGSFLGATFVPRPEW